MKQYRFYHQDNIYLGQIYTLDETNSHQIIKVLRLKLNQEIWLFNNTPFDFKATIQNILKNKVVVTILEQYANNKESPCKIHLAQAIAKGTKMDYIIQKAVELGVHTITPLISERTIVNIPLEKIPLRLEHWQKIVISACCQCGRSIIPTIEQPVTFKAWVVKNQAMVNILLDPISSVPITQIPASNQINLLIGPEGGFSIDEITWGTSYGCLKVSLGGRILRTETASIVAIASLQLQFGDLK